MKALWEEVTTSPPFPVRLDDSPQGGGPSLDLTTTLAQWTIEAAAANGRVDVAVRIAAELSAQVPEPASGRTIERWELLASLAVADLSVARVAEAHLDALAIIAECGEEITTSDGAWGVFAAEAPGLRVEADEVAGGWALSGTKPWCSAAAHLDRALITAHLESGNRRLFAIDLKDPTVETGIGVWASRGLADIASGPIVMRRTPAIPVGDPGWYLSRSGFAWGGLGVAACWFGGLVGLARSMWLSLGRREPDQIALMHLGLVDLHVQSCRLALADAARRIDSGGADGDSGTLLAERVRGVVAAAAEAVLLASAHGLGPTPLVTIEDHARRVADLQIYVRQHHAERDTARVGRLIMTSEAPPW